MGSTCGKDLSTCKKADQDTEVCVSARTRPQPKDILVTSRAMFTACFPKGNSKREDQPWFQQGREVWFGGVCEEDGGWRSPPSKVAGRTEDAPQRTSAIGGNFNSIHCYLDESNFEMDEFTAAEEAATGEVFRTNVGAERKVAWPRRGGAKGGGMNISPLGASLGSSPGSGAGSGVRRRRA